MVEISDLRAREVVNVVDGRRLGLIKDIEVDMEEGKITAIVLPGDGGGRFLGFSQRKKKSWCPGKKSEKLERTSYWWKSTLLPTPGTSSV